MVRPQARPQAHSVLAPTPAQARAAWLTFIEQVESGALQDPLGRYVRKGTLVTRGQQAQRRPKGEASRGLHVALLPQDGGEVYTMLPDDPCCPSSGPTVAYSIFTQSTGTGGSGQIHDLKLIANSSTSANNAPTGYVKLNADLNRGASGAFIYLCFTRDPAFVLKGLEYHQNFPYTAPTDVLTSFEAKFGSFSNFPSNSTHFYNIWAPNQYSYAHWDLVDLNAGAGGEYIYSFQSKNPAVSNYKYISQVGILSGSSSAIQPPSGWEKYPQDLNAGAGGDFIYFCYR
ncbi:hypothetical protein [Hymenobacter elongatus]|uniref:MABP domain-containing protein n=1 Tax=Hymenobacter elongatus TaxID=877208 RepID=A0A4Z0PRR0_9BACT|nr:hypothetical protein [Hymenobacter elongatus]TGE19711.1 hypothetical protein E5J99_02825 [Hymenobacter elongatus]